MPPLNVTKPVWLMVTLPPPVLMPPALEKVVPALLKVPPLVVMAPARAMAPVWPAPDPRLPPVVAIVPAAVLVQKLVPLLVKLPPAVRGDGAAPAPRCWWW